MHVLGRTVFVSQIQHIHQKVFSPYTLSLLCETHGHCV